MLNFNEDSVSDVDKLKAKETVWKVLIYDKIGQETISPLLKVGNLRKNGVTLHLGLHTARESIPDVPAIYFVEPTPENIARISQVIYF